MLHMDFLYERVTLAYALLNKRRAAFIKKFRQPKDAFA